MIVVSDTSCISNLLTIGHAHLLNELFGEVIIPPAVEDELQRFHSDLPDFLRRVAPRDSALLSRLAVEVDIGEAEAICVARELHADRLLIDEKLGRVARRIGHHRRRGHPGAGQAKRIDPFDQAIFVPLGKRSGLPSQPGSKAGRTRGGARNHQLSISCAYQNLSARLRKPWSLA